MSKNKAKIIEQLLTETKQSGEKYFDSLVEKSEQHLTKLLTIARAL